MVDADHRCRTHESTLPSRGRFPKSTTGTAKVDQEEIHLRARNHPRVCQYRVRRDGHVEGGYFGGSPLSSSGGCPSMRRWGRFVDTCPFGRSPPVRPPGGRSCPTRSRCATAIRCPGLSREASMSDVMQVRLHLSGVHVARVLVDSVDRLEVEVESAREWSRCRHCGFRCYRVWDRRPKRVRDLGVSGRRTTLVWRRRRFECSNCGERHLEDHAQFQAGLTRRFARRLVQDARVISIEVAMLLSWKYWQVCWIHGEFPPYCAMSVSTVRRRISSDIMGVAVASLEGWLSPSALLLMTLTVYSTPVFSPVIRWNLS